MNGDTPIHRKTFLEMTSEEQELFIKELRDRRMSPINSYNAIQEAKKAVKMDKIKTKIDKKLSAFEKCLNKCDKDLQTLQKLGEELNLLKIELEFEV